MGTGGALRWLIARWLRRRWVAVLPLVVVVAAGSTASMLAAAAAHRTASAYGDYLDRAGVGDVVINPSTSTSEVDELLRSHPSIERATSHVGLQATNDDGRPRTRAELEALDSGLPVMVIGSTDGRFATMDRPALHSGWMPTGPNEAAISTATAREFELGVGDVLTLAFWEPALNVFDSEDPESFLSEVVEPVGVEEIKIVGIVTLADEVLPDGLYPRLRVIVSPDVVARYDCRPGDAPTPGMTEDEAMAVLRPESCAATYRYYSLSLAKSRDDVKPMLDDFVAAIGALNAPYVTAGGPGLYYLIPTETATAAQAVARAIRPTVGGLTVLAVAAAAATIVLATLLGARELRRAGGEQRQWHHAGVGRRERAVMLASPPVLAVLAGVVTGIPTGWLLDTGPVGLVRAIEPDPGRRLDAFAVVAVAVTGLVTLAAIAVLAVRSARRPETEPQRAARGLLGSGRVAARSMPPSVADGLNAAYGQRSAIPALAAVTVIAGAAVAATAFAASLSALVSTPRSYGWTWDVAALSDLGYGDLDSRRIEAILDDPAVESWTVAAPILDLSLDGERTTVLLVFDRSTHVNLTAFEGRLPSTNAEVALGATTAADRGVGVGDTVIIGGSLAPRRATVTGLVVLPTLGPFESDRVSIGHGVLLPEAMLDDLASVFDAFVGIELRDGAGDDAAARLVDRLQNELATDFRLDTYTAPVRPPEIVDARSMATIPIAVGVAVLASVAALGLGFASWASVRSRRRQLAVLRAVGFTGRQVRTSVRVQALATAFAAGVLGVAPGVIAGRVLWRAFARQLGVVPDPASPWPTVGISAGVAIVAALGASWLPAHLAARANPADGLRAE